MVLRQSLAPGAAAVGDDLWPLAALVGLLTVLGAAAAWVLAARAGARMRVVAAAAEVTAAGRPAPVPELGRGDMRRLSRAVGALTARAAELQDAAEARVEALGAVLGPMDHPAAARTPAGSLIRNEALERLDARRGPRRRGRDRGGRPGGPGVGGPRVAAAEPGSTAAPSRLTRGASPAAAW